MMENYDLKGAFKFRHWLAHGRYWDPNLGRKKYDFQSLYALAEEFFECFLYKKFESSLDLY